MVWLGLVWAWAVAGAVEPPRVGVHLHGAVDMPNILGITNPFQGGGLGVSVAKRLGSPVWFETRLAGARLVGRNGGRILLAAGLRAYAFDKPDRRLRFSFALQGGLELRLSSFSATRPVPNVLGGMALDAGLSREVSLRLQVGWTTSFREVGAAHGLIGIVWQKRTPVVEVAASEDVWLSYPDCAWVTPEAAEARIGSVEAWKAWPLERDEVEEVEDEPTQGTVVIVATPGDQISIDGGAWLDVDARSGGLAVELSLRPHRFDLVGGGGRLQGELLPTGGQVIWQRVDDLDRGTWRVGFEANSAEVPPAFQPLLEAAAERTGSWSWRLVGSYSQEGRQEANEALALARAEAVRDVLVALGLPPERLLVEAGSPDPTLSMAEQRSVELQRVPVAEGP